eukprot:4426060-Pleurochrysis_carterae.AAC.1
MKDGRRRGEVEGCATLRVFGDVLQSADGLLMRRGLGKEAARGFEVTKRERNAGCGKESWRGWRVQTNLDLENGIKLEAVEVINSWEGGGGKAGESAKLGETKSLSALVH